MTDEVKLPVNITLIVDRSGSMQNIKDEVIGGINAFYAEQRTLPGEAFVTFVQFDHIYEVVFENIALANVQALTDEQFIPRGMTAMYDAIGITLTKLDANLGDSSAPQIIVIMTDGAENSSKEFTHAAVKTSIEKAKAKGWQILFLGANIDASSVGGNLGINQDNITTYSTTAEGSSAAVRSMSSKLSSMRNAYDSSSSNWANAGGTLSSIYSKTVVDKQSTPK